MNLSICSCCAAYLMRSAHFNSLRKNLLRKLAESELADPQCGFSYCNLCGTFQNETWTISVSMIFVWQEECDCGDHSRHYDGGNYHYAYYKVDESSINWDEVTNDLRRIRDYFAGLKYPVEYLGAF